MRTSLNLLALADALEKRAANYEDKKHSTLARILTPLLVGGGMGLAAFRGGRSKVLSNFKAMAKELKQHGWGEVKRLQHILPLGLSQTALDTVKTPNSFGEGLKTLKGLFKEQRSLVPKKALIAGLAGAGGTAALNETIRAIMGKNSLPVHAVDSVLSGE